MLVRHKKIFFCQQPECSEYLRFYEIVTGKLRRR
eukprot:COSAG02_NODE_86603_length_100_cov_76.000000_1_plen_33_part_11